jgi:predicted AlkP superfamily phosphohydrolase/phosphomutase
MENGAFRDRIMAHEARRLSALGFDLLLVYMRAVDIASHRYWKYLEPEKYPKIPDAELAASAHVIPTVYEATDDAIGAIVAAAPPDSNIFVLSDHGFFNGREERFVNLNAERLLERLGLLVMAGGAVDFGKSIAYPVDSPHHAPTKKIRLSLAGREPGGRIAPGDADAELARLARLLEGVTYEGGGRVFRVRKSQLPPGVDLAIDVSLEDPTLRIRAGDETWEDVVVYINRISGTHKKDTDGIFIARGPDLVPGAPLQGISILDIAPTLLFAAGLPVAEDFAGEARTELFSSEFLLAHPLRTVPTWGSMEGWNALASPVDEQLIEELRALGYL